MREKEIYYFRESLLQSLIADCISFGFVIGGLLLTRFVLGGEWYIYLFWLFCFFIVVSAKGNNKSKRFHSKKEFKEYIEKNL